MYKIIILIFLMVIPGRIQDWDPNDFIFSGDIKIVYQKNCKILPLSGLEEESLIATFGDPDTVIVGEPEGAFQYGMATTLYYGEDNFIYDEYTRGLGGFNISSEQFSFILFDSLEIRIGDSVQPILDRYKNNREIPIEYYDTPNKKIFKFSILYGFYKDGKLYPADASFGFHFDKITMKIIKIVSYLHT